MLLPLIVGPFGLVAFAYWEFRFASEPIIHKGVFNNGDMIVSYAMTVFHGTMLWSILYVLSKTVRSPLTRAYLLTLHKSPSLPRRQVLQASHPRSYMPPRNPDRCAFGPRRRHHRRQDRPLPLVHLGRPGSHHARARAPLTP